MLIDTHCHLTGRLCDEPKEVISRAKECGVEKLVCIGTNLKDSKEAIELTQKYQGVFATVGIHPEETCDNWDEFEKMVQNPKVVAIGECGLDFKDNRNQEIVNSQTITFVKQIEVSKRLGLPLVVHSRNATDEVLEILKKFQDDKLHGVFHFYNFGKSKIKNVLDLGFYFGLDGNLTYEQGMQEVAKSIPLEKIVLETDSPFLAPVPFRHQQNEPKNVKIVTQCLADIKGLTIDEIEKITTENAKKLFPNL